MKELRASTLQSCNPTYPPRLWAAREEPQLQWPVASGSRPMATGLGITIADAGVADPITHTHTLL